MLSLDQGSYQRSEADWSPRIWLRVIVSMRLSHCKKISWYISQYMSVWVETDGTSKMGNLKIYFLRSCVQKGKNKGGLWENLKGLVKWYWHRSSRLKLSNSSASREEEGEGDMWIRLFGEKLWLFNQGCSPQRQQWRVPWISFSSFYWSPLVVPIGRTWTEVRGPEKEAE